RAAPAGPAADSSVFLSVTVPTLDRRRGSPPAAKPWPSRPPARVRLVEATTAPHRGRVWGDAAGPHRQPRAPARSPPTRAGPVSSLVEPWSAEASTGLASGGLHPHGGRAP